MKSFVTQQRMRREANQNSKAFSLREILRSPVVMGPAEIFLLRSRVLHLTPATVKKEAQL